MIKNLFLVMGLLGLFSVCKGQENAEQPATMPQGKLLRVMYAFHGMRMDEFSDFDLKRSADKGDCEFCFRHYSSDVSIDGVADSLFTAAYRIIEEERMFEYGWTASDGVSMPTLRMANVSRRLDATLCLMAKGYAELRNYFMMLLRLQYIRPKISIKIELEGDEEEI